MTRAISPRSACFTTTDSSRALCAQLAGRALGLKDLTAVRSARSRELRRGIRERDSLTAMDALPPGRFGRVRRGADSRGADRPPPPRTLRAQGQREVGQVGRLATGSCRPAELLRCDARVVAGLMGRGERCPRDPQASGPARRQAAAGVASPRHVRQASPCIGFSSATAIGSPGGEHRGCWEHGVNSWGRGAHADASLCPRRRGREALNASPGRPAARRPSAGSAGPQPAT